MDYRSIIESRYDRASWLALLHDIFKGGADFRAKPLEVSANSSLATQALQLGSIKLADDNRIAVYEVKLTESVDIVTNRVSIRNLLITDWKSKGYVGAFMFCFRDSESVLRFSYVSSTFKFSEDGKLEKDETDTKRFTYLFGAGHRSRTAIRQFEELRNSRLTLDDLRKAFSIEALSDRFFKDYKTIYEDVIEFVTGKRMVKVSNKWEEKHTQEPDKAIMSEFQCFEDPEKAVRDYVKKLMGRIVFLQFIQKKGWLGVPVGKNWGDGDKEFLLNLYSNCDDKGDFIDGVLEVLFDDINTKRENDIASPILGKDIRVPYLNGGLFEKDKSDRCEFKLPASLLDKMFQFFSAYNFTIDENDPDDAEIGVDPEMLGRIFENLLEDNKDKGAFYTPKEIVQYMCKESLISYLQTDENEIHRDAIRTFVSTYNASLLDDDLKARVDDKLKKVKICDPAIGSGAFPMGLLKELFSCRSAIEGLYDDNASEIKKHIIQNNIYGVDIEKGAVDIARLRFWLALIVDEKTPHALPNMDFKIMQGNSLIPSFDGKYVNFNDKLRHMNSSKIRDAKKELFALQTKFYDSEGEEKNGLLIRIKTLILEIVRLQMDFELQVEIDRSVQVLDIFNPTVNLNRSAVDVEKARVIGRCRRLQMDLNSTSVPASERARIPIPFFDWQTMFSDVFNDAVNDNPGFDICIGNPPYIQLQANGGILGKLYADQGFSSFSSMGDIYCLFYEKGWSLLNKGGKLCYITSNKWMRAGYGKQLRTFLADKTTPLQLIDFAGVKIFENATVDTNILLFSQENDKTVSTLAASIPSKDVISKLSDFMQHEGTKCHFPEGCDSWVILTPIEQSIKNKIEAVGVPLKEWDIQINYGIKTGCNEAFIITTEKRDEILSQCKTVEERERTADLIRPILRGRDIKRYGYDWANLWLINTHNGIKGKLERIHIEDYPAVKRHLDQFWDKIKNRADQGDTPYNLRNCAYWDLFFQPHICWKAVGRNLAFALVNDGIFLTAPASFISAGEYDNLILAYLCSNVGKYFIYKNSDTTGAGDIMLNIQSLIKFPVPHGTFEPQSLSDEEINRYVYESYGLTEDEIAYIEEQI